MNTEQGLKNKQSMPQEDRVTVRGGGTTVIQI